MTLLGIELSAIANLAVRMAHADGHMDASEIDVIAKGFKYFNVPLEQAKPLILMAMAANEEDAIAIVSAMPNEHKTFIAAWLAADRICHQHSERKGHPGQSLPPEAECGGTLGSAVCADPVHHRIRRLWNGVYSG